MAVGALLACTAAGTLAAFSATYTWQSDDGTAGDFGFSDTTYSLELFGDSPLLPGASGSSVLTGPDFGDNTVEWAFAENNSAGIPVIFYVEDAEGITDAASFYSSYDFGALDGLFVRSSEEKYIALAEVSASLVSVAQALKVGSRLCWLWPSDFYTDANGTPAEQSDALKAYSEYCLALCAASYGFDTIVTDLFAAHEKTVLGVADGYSDGVYHLSHYDTRLTFGISEGCVTVGGEVVSVGRGDMFFKPDGNKRMLKDDAIYLLAEKEKFDDLAAALNEKHISFEKIGLYLVGKDNKVEPSADGNRVLFKVHPNTAEKTPAAISVTASATVRA